VREQYGRRVFHTEGPPTVDNVLGAHMALQAEGYPPPTILRLTGEALTELRASMLDDPSILADEVWYGFGHTFRGMLMVKETEPGMPAWCVMLETWTEAHEMVLP